MRMFQLALLFQALFNFMFRLADSKNNEGSAADGAVRLLLIFIKMFLESPVYLHLCCESLCAERRFRTRSLFDEGMFFQILHELSRFFLSIFREKQSQLAYGQSKGRSAFS